MIQRRIYVNLAVFMGLFFLLSYWAVTNVVKFDFIERPYRISAEFETSPGLRPGFDVTFLGIPVGSIGKVDLISKGEDCKTTDKAKDIEVPACVQVELKIKRGVDLPANLNASVRRKSAVGEPAVELQAISGAEGGHVEKGAVIPVKDKGGPNGAERQRTFTPLSYSDLFEALDKLVGAIPPEDLNTVLHEVSIGVDGRSSQFRTVVQSATELTTTLSANSALLDSLLVDLTHVSQLLLDKNSPLVQSFDNLTVLAETLAASRGDLDAILERTPAFLGQLSRLLENAGGDLGCLVDSLAVTAPGLVDTGLDSLKELLNLAGPVATVVDTAIGPDFADGLAGPYENTYIHGSFVLNFGPRAERYNPAKELPSPPANKSCALSGFPPGPGGSGTGAEGAGGSASPGAGDDSVLVPDRIEPPPDQFDPASKEAPTKRTIIDQIKDALPLMLLLLVIVAIVLYLLNQYAKKQDKIDGAKKAKAHSVSRAAFTLVKQGDDPGYLAQLDPDVIQAAEVAGEPVPPPPPHLQE